MKYLKYILISLVLFTGTLIAHAAFYPVQTQSFQLIGSGSAIGNTTLSIQTFNDTNGNPLSMTNFGSTGYGTIEPNNGSQEENISFNSITNNANGTVTLGGIIDYALNFPFATTTGITINHAGGSTFVLSNSSIFYYNNFAILSNPETVSGHWTFNNTLPSFTGTPASSSDAVNKAYVDSQVGNLSSTSLLLTPSGQNLSGNNTISGVQTFTVRPIFSSSATSITPVNSTDVAIKSYVDGVAIAGAPIANNIQTGIARSASSTQIAGGLTGGTTTPYFISSAFASSTASTTSSIVVSTNSTGHIDPSFLNGSNEQYTLNGTTTLNGFVTGNGLPYQLLYFSASSSPTNWPNDTAEHVWASTTIPANILSQNGGLKIRFFSNFANNTGTMTFRLKMNGVNIAFLTTPAMPNQTMYATNEWDWVNNASTTSQTLLQTFQWSTNLGGAVSTSNTAIASFLSASTSNINTAQPINLQVSVQTNSAGANGGNISTTVEKID